MRFIVVIAGLFSFSAYAGEMTALDSWLNSLPAMNSQDRAAFDRAARSMYDPQCKCLAFLTGGKIREAKIPLSDADRHILIEGIRRGLFIPLETNKAKNG